MVERERAERVKTRVEREDTVVSVSEVHDLFCKPRERLNGAGHACVIGRQGDAEQPACARVGCDGRPYQQAAARDLQKEMLLTLLD